MNMYTRDETVSITITMTNVTMVFSITAVLLCWKCSNHKVKDIFNPKYKSYSTLWLHKKYATFTWNGQNFILVKKSWHNIMIMLKKANIANKTVALIKPPASSVMFLQHTTNAHCLLSLYLGNFLNLVDAGHINLIPPVIIWNKDWISPEYLHHP